MGIKKTILPIVATAILAGAMFFAGCEKEKKANNDLADMSVSNISFTSCQSHRNANQKGHYNSDSVSVQVIDGTIFVNHFNLEVNCGFDSVSVTKQVTGDTVIITETGIPVNAANCMCDVNNSFRINNAPQGKFHLVIRNGMGNKKVFYSLVNNI